MSRVSESVQLAKTNAQAETNVRDKTSQYTEKSSAYGTIVKHERATAARRKVMASEAQITLAS